MNTIYTIGYTAFDIEEFINILKGYNIKCIIDVRSSPFSQFYQDYNKTILETKLKSENIKYRNYVDEFGARQNKIEYYHSDGYLDFNKFLKSENFNDGVNKIEKGIEIGYSFCLMCAEADPINCHRSIMVGRGLKNACFEVRHILKDGSIETQDALEQRLLNTFFKNRNQISMFSEMKSDEQLINEAYDIKNKEIGFRKEEE